MPSFQYTAQTHAGQPLSGTIEASGIEDAQFQLGAINLRVLTLTPTIKPAPPVRLGAGDLQTFNEYLLQISAAGLPIEQGLSALAKELRRGKLKRAIDALIADLERGTPIEQALASNRQSFPPLYGGLLDAGIQSANLPSVLHRFGRHMETVAELRDGMWRACAYPVVVLTAVLLLMTMLSYFVLPEYFRTIQLLAGTADNFNIAPTRNPFILRHRGADLPLMAIAMLYLGKIAPFIGAALLLVFGGSWLVGRVLRLGGRGGAWTDRVLHRLPVVGPVLHANSVASWLDVLSIGTAAGLDLPRALSLAGKAVGLPSFERDGDAIAQQISQGRPAADAAIRRVPATVPMTIDLVQQSDQLPQTLAALARQHHEQAERRIRLIPGRVLPPLLILIGLLAGGILYSFWVPLGRMFSLIQGMSGF